jgi:hypothetical protein
MKDQVRFNFDTLEWEGISIEQVKLWEDAFPAVDVVDVLLKKMPVWLDANRGGKANKKRWKRFIVNWLAAQQERYGKFRR